MARNADDMKIQCIHGYFKFSESKAGQLSRFMSMFGLELERSGDHYTFSDLVDAPDYSIAGSTFLGAPTSVTFAGDPWEVMRENGLVYDFTKGLVVPISTIVRSVTLLNAGNYIISTGMILPGSVTEDGSRVTDYSAQFIQELAHFRYSEVIS